MAMLRAYRCGSYRSLMPQFMEMLRYDCLRAFSTSFREEKDTLGTVLVPDDKFVFSISYSLLYPSFF